MNKFKSFLFTALLLITAEVMGASYSSTLTAVGGTQPLYLRAKESATYSLSGFGVASVILQKSKSLSTWETIATYTGDQSSTTLYNTEKEPFYVRFYASSYTSGAIVNTIADVDGDILSTVHTHPYQGNREVMQIDDLARGVFPNGIKGDLTGDVTGTITGGASSIFTSPLLIEEVSDIARLNVSDTNSQLRIDPDSTNDQGVRLLLNGASHAAANDFYLMSGTHEVIFFDDSAASIKYGHTSSYAHTFNGSITAVDSAGPQLVVKDDGTFGTDANPQLSFQDTAGTGALLGFTNAASNNFKINIERSGATVALQYGGVDVLAAGQNGTLFTGRNVNTPVDVALVGDDQAVSVASAAVVELTSDDATAANRDFTISGCVEGQRVLLYWNDTDEGQLIDTGTTLLASNWVPTAIGEQLMLYCDGTNVVEQWRRAAP